MLKIEIPAFIEGFCFFVAGVGPTAGGDPSTMDCSSDGQLFAQNGKDWDGESQAALPGLEAMSLHWEGRG